MLRIEISPLYLSSHSKVTRLAGLFFEIGFTSHLLMAAALLPASFIGLVSSQVARVFSNHMQSKHGKRKPLLLALVALFIVFNSLLSNSHCLGDAAGDDQEGAGSESKQYGAATAAAAAAPPTMRPAAMALAGLSFAGALAALVGVEEVVAALVDDQLVLDEDPESSQLEYHTRASVFRWLGHLLAFGFGCFSLIPTSSSHPPTSCDSRFSADVRIHFLLASTALGMATITMCSFVKERSNTSNTSNNSSSGSTNGGLGNEKGVENDGGRRRIRDCSGAEKGVEAPPLMLQLASAFQRLRDETFSVMVVPSSSPLRLVCLV